MLDFLPSDIDRNYIYIQTVDKQIQKIFLNSESQEEKEEIMAIPHLCYKL